MAALIGFFHTFLQEAIFHDRVLFHRINEEWSNSFFDRFMPFITDPHRAGYLALLAILIVIWKKRWNTILVLIGCIMAVGLADLTAARVLKPYFQRPRPQATEPHIRLLVPSQGSYSFPSNHAANMFAAATFFSFTVPIVGLIGTLAAFLVAYSRVYVGVHYPLDVLAGAVLGIFWAVVIFKAYVLFDIFLNPVKEEAVAPRDWRKAKFYKKRKKKAKVLRT